MKAKLSLCAIAVLTVMIAGTIHMAASDNAANNSASPLAVVKIDNFSFSPAQLTVPVGTTVQWTNGDDIPHTVVSDDKVFKSKVLDTDDHFVFTFTKTGTYSYFCSLHPRMTGMVVVR